MFEAMTDAIKEEIVRRVFLVRIKTNEGHQARARREGDRGQRRR